MGSIIVFVFWFMVLRDFWSWFSVADWRWGFGLLDWLWIMSFGTWLILWVVKRWSLFHWLDVRSFGRDLCALGSKCCSGLLWNMWDTLNNSPSIFLNNTGINEADFLLELFLGRLHTLCGTQTASLSKRLLNQFFLTTLLKSGSNLIGSLDRANLIVDWWLIIVNLRVESSLQIRDMLLFHSLLIEFLKISLMLIVKRYVMVTTMMIIRFASQELVVFLLEGLWSKC